MKRSFTALLLGALLLTLTACGGHSHTAAPDAGYDMDGENHWQVCADCGESFDQAAHQLDDSGVCSVCGAGFWDADDSRELYLFNEDGDPLRLTTYALDGSVLSDLRYTYEYNEDGLLIKSTETTDGAVTETMDYAIVDGTSVPGLLTHYDEDGSWFINEYDRYSNVIRAEAYDADGSVTISSDSEYAQDEDGNWYESGRVEVYSDGSRSVSEYAPDGSNLSYAFYDAQGNLVVG